MPSPAEFRSARRKGWRFFGGPSEKYYPNLVRRKAFLDIKKTNCKVKNKVKIKVYKIKEEKGTIGFNPWYDWICSKKS
jgi:hypothetical protein